MTVNVSVAGEVGEINESFQHIGPSTVQEPAAAFLGHPSPVTSSPSTRSFALDVAHQVALQPQDDLIGAKIDFLQATITMPHRR